MNNALIGAAVLACTLLAAGGAPPPAADSDVIQAASGRGSFRFGHEEQGVGYFRFNVRTGSEIVGTLLFAAEDHDHYPDVIVRVDAVTSADFGERSVKLRAQGHLHDEQVRVTASGYDGEGASKPDRFSIRCTDTKGHVVFSAQGELTTGDILIGAD